MQDANNPLKLFIELANFDQTLNKLRKQIERLEDEKSFLRTNYINLVNKLETLKKKVHDSTKAVHSHELIMQDLDNQLQRQKNLLEKVTNQKEQTAVKNSIAQIKQQQHDYESTLIDEWNKLELAQKELEVEQAGLAKAEAELELNLNQKSLEINQIQLSLETELQQRQHLLVNIPSEWLKQYETLYLRISDPIVEVQQGACIACFEPLTNQMLIELKRHKLLQCQSCHRFLYI